MCKISDCLRLNTFLILTAQVLQDEVQLPSCLEGIDKIYNEGMLHLFQDVPLCLGMSCVLGVAYNHSLANRTKHISSLVKYQGFH